MLNLKEIFKKSIKIIKSEGFSFFLKKAFNFVLNRWYQTKLRLRKERYIKKINRFNSSEINEILNFAFFGLHGLIKPMQIESEFKKLLKIFKENRPKMILEIGTANGGALFCFSKQAADNATIISIDLPRGKFGGGYPKWKIPIYQAFKKQNQKLFLLREDSHKKETLERVKAILNGEKMDFLFIDGDHTYEGVKKDFEMYGSLVRKGGVIAFHDIVLHPSETECEVIKYWNKIKNRYKFIEIIANPNQNWAGIGVIYK